MIETSEEKSNGILIITVSGRLDSGASLAFQEKLQGLIALGERRMVIDFLGLQYVSSAGLRAVLVAAKALAKAPDRLAFCSLIGPVRQVFEVTGLTTILSIYPSQQEAIESFQA